MNSMNILVVLGLNFTAIQTYENWLQHFNIYIFNNPWEVENKLFCNYELLPQHCRTGLYIRKQNPTSKTRRDQWYYQAGEERDRPAGIARWWLQAEETATDHETTCVRRQTRPTSLTVALLGYTSKSVSSFCFNQYHLLHNPLQSPFTFVPLPKEWPQLADHRTKLAPWEYLLQNFILLALMDSQCPSIVCSVF